MANLFPNFLNLFLSINLKIILSSLMMRILRQNEQSFRLSNFLKEKGSFSARNCINLNHLSDFALLRNIERKLRFVCCVGAMTNQWIINYKKRSLEKQKARISRPSFFYIVRCEWNLNNSILASREFICNYSEVL